MPYGMIDTKIFDSTVMLHGKDVVYVFMGMVALADKTHVCDFGRHALANRLRVTIEELDDALGKLQAIDPDSKSQEWGGKRIVALKDIPEVESNRGWYIVNRESYIHEIKRENRNERQAELMRKIRGSSLKANKWGDVSDPLAYVDVDVDIIKEGVNADPKDIIWKEGLKFTGVTRSLLGKLCKQYSEDALVKAILRTKEHCPAEPKSFLLGCLKEPDPEKGAI